MTGAASKRAETVAWENPLIPNARLRQIYLAMMQARALERALPAAKRARAVAANAESAGKKSAAAKIAGSFGLEAALVSAAFDLGAGDLVSDALAGGAVELLRGASLGEILQPSAAARRRIRKATAAAPRLVAPPTIVERVWSAMGAAAALKAAHANVAQQAGVVALFTLPGEVPATLWKTVLSFAAEEVLPMVFVVLPATRERGNKAQHGGGRPRAAKFGEVGEISTACGVPGIAVDADDAVAIYRVAQESIGRARAGGGAALIECLPFILEGAAPSYTGDQRTGVRRSAPADAIATLERHLLQRGVATKPWIEREAKSFALRLAKSQAR